MAVFGLNDCLMIQISISCGTLKNDEASRVGFESNGTHVWRFFHSCLGSMFAFDMSWKCNDFI